MTKDRLAALKAVCFQNIHQTLFYLNIKAQEGNDDEMVQIDMNTVDFMEEFYNQVQDIRSNIENAHKYVDEVKRLHSSILSAPTTDDKIKNELEDRMFEIKRTAQLVRQKLKSKIEFLILKIFLYFKIRYGSFRFKFRKFETN